jgi:methionine aminopeptidase
MKTEGAKPPRHGIPDDRALEDGDILNVDVTVRV